MPGYHGSWKKKERYLALNVPRRGRGGVLDVSCPSFIKGAGGSPHPIYENRRSQDGRKARRSVINRNVPKSPADCTWGERSRWGRSKGGEGISKSDRVWGRTQAHRATPAVIFQPTRKRPLPGKAAFYQRKTVLTGLSPRGGAAITGEPGLTLRGVHRLILGGSWVRYAGRQSCSLYPRTGSPHA